jgi:hypothetical protein
MLKILMEEFLTIKNRVGWSRGGHTRGWKKQARGKKETTGGEEGNPKILGKREAELLDVNEIDNMNRKRGKKCRVEENDEVQLLTEAVIQPRQSP